VAILASGRPPHFAVTARAVLVIGSLEAQFIHVVGGSVLLPQGGGGEWLGGVAPLTGHNRGCAAVLVASDAIGVLHEGTGSVVMALGAVLDERDVLGMVEIDPFVQVHQGIQLYGIRYAFAPGAGRGHGQRQDDDSPD